MDWRGILQEYRNQIVIGDARELARAIPDESIDLIFTDPVYDRIDDYRWLAETAARVLKPNSAALVWYDTGKLPETLGALISGGLAYRWQIAAYMPGLNMRYANCNLFRQWRGCLVMGLNKPRVMTPTRDYIVDGNPAFDPAFHGWDKNPTVLSYYLEGFTRAGGVVLDPFTGGGTVPAVCKMLGRHYVAFEIDPATAERARERVAQTQPPLFVVQPEQAEMAL